ncbi:MAG: YifB family Mg chelatase-like AAA ATPase [Elusimicrobia bacterium]|nr:YifB family Mg chelatase-like AAA ATPase [Elusimicrobiota bacterium]
MIAKVWSAAVRGMEGYPVSVELEISGGLPRYATVGLPDTAVRESRERVASALRNSGYQFPARRITVNLAPAEHRKRGTQFDLPVGLGMLAASGQLPDGDWRSRFWFLGELALDGRVKPVSGVLPMAAAARAHGAQGLVLAPENAAEAAAVGVPSFPVESLEHAARFVAGRAALSPARPRPAQDAVLAPDLAEVKGQALAKRALEIAAAGGHHLLLSGPPGCGKSMLAQRLPGILPPLSEPEALELATVLSVAGELREGRWPSQRPFRSPHHSASPASLIGGGQPARPGEVSLAHAGVLFLDELPEFSRDALEGLRVPLESGRAAVARVQDRVVFPARLQLVAAQNPCPCGYLGHPGRECACGPGQIARYRAKVSGPLLDRIDLRVELAPLAFEEWADGAASGEPSSAVLARVLAARGRSEERLGPGRANASLRPSELRRLVPLSSAARATLEKAADRFQLSARGLDRALRVARTIADLAGESRVASAHVAEAALLTAGSRETGR